MRGRTLDGTGDDLPRCSGLVDAERCNGKRGKQLILIAHLLFEDRNGAACRRPVTREPEIMIQHVADSICLVLLAD